MVGGAGVKGECQFSWKIPWVFQGQDETQIEPLSQESRYIFNKSATNGN